MEALLRCIPASISHCRKKRFDSSTGSAKKGNRSRLIDKAVKRYVTDARRANLRKLLKQGALRRAERDLRLAEESFFLEEEAWHTNGR